MTVVNAKTFWNVAWDADEAQGLTVRVGPWRCAPLNDKWGCLKDGADYPSASGFDTRQDAVDFMVDYCLAQHDGVGDGPDGLDYLLS